MQASPKFKPVNSDIILIRGALATNLKFYMLATPYALCPLQKQQD